MIDLQMFRLECAAPGCDCYVAVMFQGPLRALWQAVLACGRQAGFMMGTEPGGPHYCGCSHVQEGSHDPR